MDHRLMRSRQDVMIGGVCSGLGRYLQIDTAFVRLFFVLLALAGNGLGVFIYILLWIILPVEGQAADAPLDENVRQGSQEIADKARAMGDEFRSMVGRPHPQTGIFIGGALIFLGLVYLVRSLNLPWLTWLDFDILWPLLLIVAGFVLLRRYFGER